jgi:acyl dehydratase
MASRYQQLMEYRFPVIEQEYSARDTILYALGVGAAHDPLDPLERRLVVESDLVALPSMAVTLAYPGFWYREQGLELDFLRVVHASERIELLGPLPVAARVSAIPRIVAIHDKGEGRGSLVVSHREVIDRDTGRHLATVRQTAFCRGDGGLGGPVVPPPAPHPVPERSPDRTEMVPIDPRAALIYRLSGDDNPLHVDPAVAQAAGFPRPVLHGLASYGHICRLLMRRRGLEARLQVMDCRFVGPVYPGEAMTVESWSDGGTESFRASVGDRRVIDNGLAVFA